MMAEGGEIPEQQPVGDNTLGIPHCFWSDQQILNEREKFKVERGEG